MLRKLCRSRWGLAAVATLCLALVVSCSREDRARRGGTLIVGEINDYESLNPLGTTDAHARDIYNLLFLTLLDERPDFLSFEPRLASSYEFSPDRRTLTFHLRENVVWSDGTPVTARDVAATFRAQKDSLVLWPGRHLKEHIDSVTVVDAYTIQYHFNRVYPYQLMDANDGVILSERFIGSVSPAELGAVPVERIPMDGPFRIESWVRGQALTLVPYERYHLKGKPHLSKVVFKIIPDQTTLITQLKNGEIDCMESLPPQEIGDLKGKHAELLVYDYPDRRYNYIGWNGARPPFDTPRVRRALTLAIDRKAIIDNLYYGHATECTSPFVPLIWAYNPGIRPLPYDTVMARRILAAEGFRDENGDGWLERGGKRFEFEIITNYGNQLRVDIQIMVQEMLRKIGIKVNPIALEWTVFLDRVKSGKYDAQVNAWRIGTKADLAPIWSCEARGPVGYNRVSYCNPLVDSLNAVAASMIDLEKARPLFYRVQEIIYDEQPYTFLYRPNALSAVHERFKDVRPDAIGMYHYLEDWWESPGK